MIFLFSKKKKQQILGLSNNNDPETSSNVNKCFSLIIIC